MSLGIYFGPKLISLVDSEGKKLLGNVNVPLAALNDASGEEKVPEQFKIAAVIKDEMRKNAIDAKGADIVLPGKDLIIRTFHMPLLAQDELANAVRFEAKKYIPFKVEDLVCDFQIKVDKTTRKNFVLFVGMKKENLEKYVSIFSQLNLKLNSIEYAGFGILRLLKLAKIKEKGIVALINIDFVEDDEVNFVVLEDGFPLFSRDITLSGEGAPADPTRARPEPAESLEKLKIELRISLDFYLRKFPTKNIQNVIFIAPEEHKAELEGFIKERGLAAKFIECNKLFDKPVVFSSGFLKSYACSINKTIKGSLTIDLLPGKAKKHAGGNPLAGLSSLPLLSQIKLDFRALLVGACIIAVPYIINNYQRQPVEQMLSVTKGNRPVVTIVNAESDLSQLESVDAGYKEKIKVVKKLLSSRLVVTPSLDALPRAGIQGLWLTSVSLSDEGKGFVMYLTGAVYLGDSNREMEAVNKFISSLRNTPEFSRSFNDISVLSLDQGQIETVHVTNFKLACRSQ